jgi:hypothetical protein
MQSKMQPATGDAALSLVIDFLLQFANEHAHLPLSREDVEKLEALDSQFFIARVQGGFPTANIPQPANGATRLFGDSRLPYCLATPGEIGGVKALRLGIGQPTLQPTAEWVQAMRNLRALASAKCKYNPNGITGTPNSTMPRGEMVEAAIRAAGRILEDVPASSGRQHLLDYAALIDGLKKTGHTRRAAEWAVYVLLSPPPREDRFKRYGQLAWQDNSVVATPGFFEAHDAAWEGASQDHEDGRVPDVLHPVQSQGLATAANEDVAKEEERCAPGTSVQPGNRPLRQSRENAYRQFLWAMEQNPGLTTDPKVYDWLKDHADSFEKLPMFNTWSRYLREARTYHQDHKHTPQIAKVASGKSVVRSQQI